MIIGRRPKRRVARHNSTAIPIIKEGTREIRNVVLIGSKSKEEESGSGMKPIAPDLPLPDHAQ